MEGTSHRFLVTRPGRPLAVWDPPQATEQTGRDVAYFGRALAVAAQMLEPSPPLTFVLTWDLGHLPETGPHVVAIVQGDEDARIPRWSTDVLITFKCYGSRPHWMPVFPRPGVAEALEIANFARRGLLWLPGAAVRAWSRGRPWRQRPPLAAVPLGYYNQLDHPSIPFDRRHWSVSFAGSVNRNGGGRGPHRWLGTPKDRVRAQMVATLGRLEREMPAEAIKVIELPDFPPLFPGRDGPARQLAPGYSELLAQTRICLVPRGHSPETFRFFEALRAGCVVVCESLPDHWFYRGAPVISMRHPDELGTVLTRLLADPAALAQRHEAAVAWWQTRCSEAAVGRFMAARITEARRRHLSARVIGARFRRP